MEKLVKCSKILYEQDIIKKTKELMEADDLKLAQKYGKKRLYKNFDDYEKNKEIFFTNIKVEMSDWIEKSYHYPDYNDIWNIAHILDKYLEDFTGNKKWSEIIIYRLLHSIQRILISLDLVIYDKMCDGVHQRSAKFEKTLIIDEYIELFLDSGCGGGENYLSDFFDELYYDLYPPPSPRFG